MSLYEPNKVQWKVGDLVLLEYDAKEPKMLVKIERITRKGKQIWGSYIDSETRKSFVTKAGKPRKCWSPMKEAHDPARFAVPTQQSAWATWYKQYYYRESEKAHGFVHGKG